MPFLGESRRPRGPGYLPLQDFRSKVVHHMRANLIGVRITGRLTKGTQLGHHQVDPKAVGDVTGALAWPTGSAGGGPGPPVTSVPLGIPERLGNDPPVGIINGPSHDPTGLGRGGGGGEREIPAWSWIFPVVTAIESHSDRLQGPITKAPANYGPAISPIASDAAIVGGGVVISAGNAIQRGLTGIGFQRVRPVKGPGWMRNTGLDQQFLRSPDGWPDFPGNYYGIVVRSTDDDLQLEYFHPTDPRLISSNHSGPAASSSVICDLRKRDNTIDLERMARTNSMLWVIHKPSDAPEVEGDRGPNALAWNIGLSGRGDSMGGYVIDIPTQKGGRGVRQRKTSGPITKAGMDKTSPKVMGLIATGASVQGFQGSSVATGNLSSSGNLMRTELFGLPFQGPSSRGAQARGRRGGRGVDSSIGKRAAAGEARVIAKFGVTDGGPFDPGGIADPHQIGKDGDGRPINQGHLSTGALWRDRNFPLWDGPMLFEDEFRPGEDSDSPVRVHLAFDPEEAAWAWWSTTSIGGSGGDDDEPGTPETPGRPGPTTPPPAPPGHIPPGGPITPGSGGDGNVNPVTGQPYGHGIIPIPPTPTSTGQGTRVRGEFHGEGYVPPGGENAPPPRPDASVPPALMIASSGSPYSRGVTRLRRHYRASCEHTFPVITFMPQLMRKGARDFRNTTVTARGEQNYRDHTTPVTARLEAFGAQGGRKGGPYIGSNSGGSHAPGRPWNYTQKPGNSRYLGGTAPGGLIFSNPEVDLAYSDEDLAPAGALLSSTYVGFGPGVRCFWGLPELATGGVRDAWSARRSSAGHFRFAEHNVTGTATDSAAILAGGMLATTAEDLLVAGATQTQGDTPLTKGISRIAVVGATGDAATLPAAEDGAICVVVNAGVNTMQIFPPSGGNIDGNATNVSVDLAAGSVGLFFGIDGTRWSSLGAVNVPT